MCFIYTLYIILYFISLILFLIIPPSSRNSQSLSISFLLLSLVIPLWTSVEYQRTLEALRGGRGGDEVEWRHSVDTAVDVARIDRSWAIAARAWTALCHNEQFHQYPHFIVILSWYVVAQEEWCLLMYNQNCDGFINTPNKL